MSHLTIANRRRINLQKLTPSGNVIWSKSVMLANWPTRRNYTTVTDCCGNDHVAAAAKLRSNTGLELQPTDDGGCLLIVERARLSGESYQSCRAAMIRLDDCGCVRWERHYGSGHPYGITSGSAGSTAGGWPIPSADVSISGNHLNGFGRVAVSGDQVFVALASKEGNGPTGDSNSRIIERVDLSSGAVTRYELVDRDVFFGSGVAKDASCGPCVANFSNDGAAITRITSSTPLQQFYAADGSLIVERGTKGPAPGLTGLDASGVIHLAAYSQGIICDEVVSTVWSGLTIRSFTPGSSPTAAPDPSIVASTYGALSNSRHSVACGSADGSLYAFALSDSPRFITTTGLRRLTVSGSTISQDWFYGDDISVNCLAADSSGVYAVGSIGALGKTFGVWKHAVADGSLLWCYSTPLHSAGAFNPYSICLASDGNLYVCGDESSH